METFFFIGSIFCAIISAYLLIFRSQEYQIFSNRLLGIVLLSSAILVTAYLLIKTGTLIHVPYLYKIFAPINFITTPICYLYVKSVLYNENEWNKKYNLLFIPSMIVFINYLPFYFLNYHEKIKIVESLNIEIPSSLVVKGMLIPDQYLSFFWFVQGTVYLYLMWNLIWKCKINFINSPFKDHTKLVFNWIKLFVFLNTIIGVGIVLFSMAVNISPSIVYSLPILFTPDFIVSLSFLIMCGYLLMRPYVLFGFPFEIINPKTELAVLQKNETITLEPFVEKMNQITNFFNDHKPFLNASLDVYTLANMMELPCRELSFILNHCFEQNFNDFVNQYRIHYINQKIQEGFLERYKIKTLYLQAGFISKSTFNIAFKKVNKCTPTKYIENFNA